MTWALDQQIVTDATARHVLLCLANYADKIGRGAFPSTETLAEDTGLSRRSVQYKLDALEHAGVITRGNQALAAVYIERGDRRPVVYDLAMPRGASAASREERGANGDTTGCKPCSDGVQTTTERGAGAAPNPSDNRQSNRQVTDKAQGAEVVLPDWVPRQAWSDFLDMRKRIKKPPTPAATKLLLSKLQALRDAGNDPERVLEQSIMNSWQGLFELKTRGNAPAGKPNNHTNFQERKYGNGTPDDEIPWLNAPGA